MEQDEIFHDRCACLLLDDYVQDVGAAKPNAEKEMYGICVYSRRVWGLTNRNKIL